MRTCRCRGTSRAGIRCPPKARGRPRNCCVWTAAGTKCPCCCSPARNSTHAGGSPYASAQGRPSGQRPALRPARPRRRAHRHPAIALRLDRGHRPRQRLAHRAGAALPAAVPRRGRPQGGCRRAQHGHGAQPGLPGCLPHGLGAAPRHRGQAPGHRGRRILGPALHAQGRPAVRGCHHHGQPHLRTRDPDAGTRLRPGRRAPRRAGRLQGILNGIDTALWNPSQDTLIPAPFSADRLEGKAACKAALRRTLGLAQDGDRMLFGLVGRMTEQKASTG